MTAAVSDLLHYVIAVKHFHHAYMYRVTTCKENLEMSINLTAVREMSGILLKIRAMSGKKSCQGKVA